VSTVILPRTRHIDK